VNVPQEARERIQVKAQTKLMIEKALQVTESPRDLCMKAGGGGPQEICALLESRRSEFGVTKPDECFLVLMTSTITTYNAIELKSYPAPSLPEE